MKILLALLFSVSLSAQVNNPSGGPTSTPVSKTDGGTGADTSALPTGCVQFPCFAAKVAPTTYSSTSSLAPTLILTTPNDATQHVWGMCFYGRMTVVGTAGTYTGGFDFTDATVAHTATSLNTAMSTTSLGGTVTGAQPTCQNFVADANTQILYRITATGVTGTPTLEYAFTLTRIQ